MASKRQTLQNLDYKIKLKLGKINVFIFWEESKFIKLTLIVLFVVVFVVRLWNKEKEETINKVIMKKNMMKINSNMIMK